MTIQEAIREACSITGLVYRSIGDYSRPSDGFCNTCPASRGGGWTFQNSGDVFDYIRRAVLAQLKRDGYAIHKDFDPETGKERS